MNWKQALIEVCGGLYYIFAKCMTLYVSSNINILGIGAFYTDTHKYCISAICKIKLVVAKFKYFMVIGDVNVKT